MALDDKKLFQEILRSVGIVVHDKYLKKANWKDVLMEKLLLRIEKPLVRHYIQDLAAGAAQRMADRIVKQFGGVNGFLKSLAEDERHLYHGVLESRGATYPIISTLPRL
jgi:hypothetical protein